MPPSRSFSRAPAEFGDAMMFDSSSVFHPARKAAWTTALPLRTASSGIR